MAKQLVLIFVRIILFCLISRPSSGEEEITVTPELEAAVLMVQSIFPDVNLQTILPALLQYSNISDSYLTTPEVITKYGYPVELHTLITSDGYILEMHRIPYSSESPASDNKPVVLLQHGLLSTSYQWVGLGPQKSLAYLLVDAGYDVWMSNSRGNSYSRKHVTLSTSSSKFWDFSWHEMALYDLPAVIDYVLYNTSQRQLYYVGHSMGTTLSFVLTSSLPQYNAKIKLLTALAPTVFLGNAKSPLSKFLAWNPLTYIIAGMLGIKQFAPGGILMTTIANTICTDQSIVQQVCSTAIFSLMGFDEDQLDLSTLPAILSHFPAGSSGKALLHYGQLMQSGHFRQYDYLPIGNIINYSRFDPPDYNLSAVTAPVWLVYADNDWYSDPQDVFKLNRTIPNSVGAYRVNLSTFNHVDFVLAKDVKTLVNDKIIEFFKSYV